MKKNGIFRQIKSLYDYVTVESVLKHLYFIFSVSCDGVVIKSYVSEVHNEF